MILLYSLWNSPPPNLSSSFCTPSGPVARLFFNDIAAHFTSVGVIGVFSGRGGPSKGGRDGSVCLLVNWDWY